jgi:hypothetical protein
MIELNLLPDVKIELLKAQRIRSKIIAACLIIVVVSLSLLIILVIYIFTVQTLRSDMADKDIKTYSTKIQNTEDLSKTLTIQNQLTKISEFNSKKNINSRVFNMFAALMPSAPNSVSISSFSINSNIGTIQLGGQAVNGYVAVEAFRKTLERAQINYNVTDDTTKAESAMLASDINLLGTSYGRDTKQNLVVKFSISFKYDPILFSQTVKTMKYSIIGTNDVTDSYLGLPNAIFEPAATDVESGGN